MKATEIKVVNRPRAVIYARYSSDLQREESIEDQIRLCKEKASHMGWEVVEAYSDAAISGSRLPNRPGISALLDNARGRHRQFEIVIAEALDRLSRDQEDIAGIFKRLGHLDIRIHTLAEGDISELHVGLKGTMNALFLKDLASKVRRGQRGRAEAHRAAGGLSYGYRVVREIGSDGEIERGRREIDPEQAAIIQRIFKEYVGGRSPRAIATDLNREGVPSPRGGAWNASTINGHPQRLHGILQNPLYSGRMIYGRLTYRRDPETGARESHLVDPSKWVHIAMPEWRIVSDDHWDQAQQLRSRFSDHKPHQARRAKHLLSGLISCGVCGGAYTMRSTDRLGCVAHREKGTCDNNKTILLVDLERRVLSGVKSGLLAPEVFSAFATEYQLTLDRARADKDGKYSAVAQQLEIVTKRITRVVDAIADGAPSAPLREKLASLEAERKTLESKRIELDGMASAPDIHPNLPELYARRVAELERHLKEGGSDSAAAREILRSLILRIVVFPGENRGETKISVHGSVPEILGFAQNSSGRTTTHQSVVAVVPGGGFEPPTRRFSVACSTN